ncbi:uncharacterized protein METZ01_LOCUS218110, partial [marine metagenome]
VSFDQKILVIRFSSIGDIVLATSPLKTIRRAYPDAQITFLTLDTFAPLLEYHPDIDALVSISKRMSLIELWGFADHIRRKQYRHIFDLHNSIRSNLVTLRSSSPVYQLKKPRWNRFLLFYFHHNEFGSDFSTLKMYHEHLGSIWNENDVLPATVLKVSNYEQKMARNMLLDKNIFDEFIAVVPGAAWTQKQWPAEKYIETLNQLDLPAVLLGEKKDTICFDIAKRSSSTVNLAGQTTLRQALAVLANSAYVIGSDTGLTHAAEALGKQVYMILGPTSPETGAGVNLSGSTNIETDVWCRPCSQNGKLPCYRKTQECMDSIVPNDVIQSLLPG